MHPFTQGSSFSKTFGDILKKTYYYDGRSYKRPSEVSPIRTRGTVKKTSLCRQLPNNIAFSTRNVNKVAGTGDIEPTKAWFRIEEGDWYKVPLTHVKDVEDLKRAIKIAASPSLDKWSTLNLVLKAAKEKD